MVFTEFKNEEQKMGLDNISAPLTRSLVYTFATLFIIISFRIGGNSKTREVTNTMSKMCSYT